MLGVRKVSLVLAVCGLTITRVTRTAGFAGTIGLNPGYSAASHCIAWNKNSRSLTDLWRERISKCFATTAVQPISITPKHLWRSAPFIAGVSLIWSSRVCQRQWQLVRMSSTGGDLISDTSSSKISKTRTYQTPQHPISASKSANSSIATPYTAEMNGLFAVNKPRNWTSFDVVNKVRGTLGKKLREENPSLTPKQCRVKVRICCQSCSSTAEIGNA
jgi:hypothetical protein